MQRFGNEPRLTSAAGVVNSFETPNAASLTLIDRRRYPRRLSHCVVSVLSVKADSLTGPGSSWAFRSASVRGRLTDLSMGGAAFISSAGFSAGEAILLEIKHPRRDFSVVRRATVVGDSQQQNELQNTVCKLDTELAIDEVVQLSSFCVLRRAATAVE